VLALLVGFVLLLLLPRPWNGVGFAAAITWEIITILYCLWWSKRQAPQVGTNTLLGLGAVVVQPCTPWGRVRLGGETWRARSEAAVRPGTRVLVRSVEGLTLHVEPE
jgi:membrane protein implicated in regulation of membrane protease activity